MSSSLIPGTSIERELSLKEGVHLINVHLVIGQINTLTQYHR
jgi:hypothetical protein